MWWFKKKKDDQEPATQAEPQEPGLNAGELTGGLKFSDNEPSLTSDAKNGEVKIGEPVRFDAEPEPAVVAEPVKTDEGKKEEVKSETPHDDFGREQQRVSLRRRFIGAAMILAAVAVVSPFLFDKGEPPPSITIPLSIPNENGADVASLDVPGKGAAPVPNKQFAAKPAAPKAEVKKPEPKKVEVKKAPEKEKPAAKPEPKKEVKPAVKPEAKKLEKVEAKKEVKAAAPVKGSYFIQLVATSDAAKAEALKRQVAAAGLPVYTEQIASKTGKVTRVRVGPFGSQDAANEAKAALGMSGIASGNVQQVK